MKKHLLWASAALCALTAVLFAAAALGICGEGAARRAEDPGAAIYTPELAAERARAPLAALGAAAALATVCAALGVRDENAEKPIRDAGLSRMAEKSAPGAHLNAARWAVLALAAACVAAGILNGSMRDVVSKAVNICTECIGLG